MITTTIPQAVPLTNPMLEAALQYAARGYKVFPLWPDHDAVTCGKKCKAKAPLTEYGFLDATADELTIRSWWQKYPNANIGLPCANNGLFVIDLDTKVGKPDGIATFGRLLTQYQVATPETPFQRTPGGTRPGLHIVCKHPPEPFTAIDKYRELNGATGKLEETGIDARSKAYIVVAPSTVHGKPYEWSTGYGLLEREPVEMPEWLVNIFTHEATRTVEYREPPKELSERELNELKRALAVTPADDRDEWIAVGMVLKAHGLPFEPWLEWSQKSDKYEPGDCEKEWKSFKRGGRQIGTLFRIAKQYGFKFSDNYFELSDVGNADLFEVNYGHLLRWFETENRWLVWNGKRWASDETRRAVAYAVEMVKQMLSEATTQTQREFAVKCHTTAKIKAFMELAKANAKLAVTAAMLDTDPWLLNCRNGTLDLRTGELREHRQEDFITKLAPVDFDRNAQAPRFEQALREIFSDKQEVIEYVQRGLGYSLAGEIKEHKFFVAHGGGRNGKSLLFGVMLELLGDYALVADPALLTSKYDDKGASPGVYELRGSRLASVSETPEGARLNETTVKALTGNAYLKGRPLYQGFTTFPNTVTLWMDTNHLPAVKSQGVAIWERTRRIPFSARFSDRLEDVAAGALPMDKDLPQKLRAEYSGVLNWLLQGCLAWQKRGLCEPKQVSDATQEYRESEDTLAAFIEECCLIEPGAKAMAQDMRSAYVTWCKLRQEPVMSKNSFPERMKEKGFVQSTTNVGKVWSGITLKPPEPITSQPQIDPWANVK